ncbi:MAG: hypothetical protein H7210_12065 [Pyrinomonadaceae bacterium]|nr:hypothetical protein [Phycisphaerales bacterium]
MNVYQPRCLSAKDASAGAEPPQDPSQRPGEPAPPAPAAPSLFSQPSGQNDDYLWDKSGPADPGIVKLEAIMGTLRLSDVPASPTLAAAAASVATDRIESPALKHEGAVRAASGSRHRKHAWVMPALGMAALFGIIALIGWPMRPWGPGTQREVVNDDIDPRSSGGLVVAVTGWEASLLSGAPVIGTKMLSSPRAVHTNDWLSTDAVSSAQLVDAQIGTIKVEPNSRLRITKVLNGQQWFELGKGRIDATIHAPPKLFFVKTKSALAVDMGCAYTLESDEQGNGMLHVTLGWVELQRDGRVVRVPSGRRCAMFEGIGPGTPVNAEAPETLVTAVGRFDKRAGAKSTAPLLDEVLSSAGSKDGVTLWHVLQQVEEADRERVIEKLGSIVAPPAGISKDALLKLDQTALDQWWTEIKYR